MCFLPTKTVRLKKAQQTFHRILSSQKSCITLKDAKLLLSLRTSDARHQNAAFKKTVIRAA